MKQKYIVLKYEDCNRYLWDEQRLQLKGIMQEIAECRERDRKPTDNKYLVINIDEPYADEVLEIMKQHGHWG